MQREQSKEPQIAGAFGTISAHDEGSRHGARARFLTLIAIIGPGLIVMVGDNDAGGVSTYAQAGQNFGYSLLWTLPLLIPVLIVVQEMAARIGAVTGVGYGRLIRERFGNYWGNLSILSILILNFLIIVTEFIGISLSMEYFGVSPYVSVPVAVTLLFAVTASGSFRRWERFMMLFIAVNFVVIPLVLIAHPSFTAMVHSAAIPHIRGGASSVSVLLIISIIGTTVAPWQLFFQESNIVDKRITPRWLNYERVDTIIGSFIVVDRHPDVAVERGDLRRVRRRHRLGAGGGLRHRSRRARRHELLHQRARRGERTWSLRGTRHGDALRDHPAQRVRHRRGRRHAREFLRVE